LYYFVQYLQSISNACKNWVCHVIVYCLNLHSAAVKQFINAQLHIDSNVCPVVFFLQMKQELANSSDDEQQQSRTAAQLQNQFPNLALKLSESENDNQPIHASDVKFNTALGIINKYIADIQTNAMIGEKPVEFWLNSCPKPYSQLSILAVDLLAAPASQAFVERLFSVCGMLSNGRRNRMEKSLEMRVWLKVNFNVLNDTE